MSQITIRSLMRKRLEAMAGNLPKTKYRNEPFDPPGPDTPYQVVDFVFGNTQNPIKGAAFTREVGFMQVALHYPKGLGEGPALQQAQAIRARFKYGTTEASGNVTMVVNYEPSINAGTDEPDRYVLVVKVMFYANVS